MLKCDTSFSSEINQPIATSNRGEGNTPVHPRSNASVSPPASHKRKPYSSPKPHRACAGGSNRARVFTRTTHTIFYPDVDLLPERWDPLVSCRMQAQLTRKGCSLHVEFARRLPSGCLHCSLQELVRSSRGDPIDYYPAQP